MQSNGDLSEVMKLCFRRYHRWQVVPTTFWFILTNSYFSFLQIIMDNYILYSSIRKGYPIPSNWQLDNQDKDI